MFKWLFGRGKSKDTTPPALSTTLYGRYVYKPVTSRALMVVTNLDVTSFSARIASRQIKLNDQVVTEDSLLNRLDSGQYKIELTDTTEKKVWYFFIS